MGWRRRRVGAPGGDPATEADVLRGMERLVREQAALYEVIWSKLTARQQMVLRAIAEDPGVQITAAQTLVDAEHLVRMAPGRYGFDDPFFLRWVQVVGLPDIGVPTPPIVVPGQ